MTARITRRDFLKLSGAAALGFGYRDYPPGGNPAAKRGPSFRLGRTVYSLRYYQEPSTSSRELGYYISDTVVNIKEQELGNPGQTRNPLWLRTDDGWLHSAYVQPVQNVLNQPFLNVPHGGMLCEVTVPYTQSWQTENNEWKRGYRYYYGSTHWVTYAFTGANNQIWYEVLDDDNRGYFHVTAEHLRPITADELTPLSPGARDKRIEVDLTRQRVIAYEGNHPVYAARTATGYFPGDTPIGEYRIERKQPSRHMSSNLEGNEFDLPGVPWVCYISWTGVSLHGTYWHNNYGTPQSHGCINLTPEAAKWIYRWTEPSVPVGEDYLETDQGTRVVVY
ncbi:MAG: L,D-transpeptidase [Anaerolineales bacterium]|nr:L,D-transpeptidase [Anaerolineales bacterium]